MGLLEDWFDAMTENGGSEIGSKKASGRVVPERMRTSDLILERIDITSIFHPSLQISSECHKACTTYFWSRKKKTTIFNAELRDASIKIDDEEHHQSWPEMHLRSRMNICFKPEFSANFIYKVYE